MTEKNIRLGEGDTVDVRKVPRTLAKAYSGYVKSLPVSQQMNEIPFSAGSITQKDLVVHLSDNTAIGKEAAQVFLEATRGEHQDEGIEITTERELVRKTSEGFKAAAAELQSRQD